MQLPALRHLEVLREVVEVLLVLGSSVEILEQFQELTLSEQAMHKTLRSKQTITRYFA
jgi:hypothetical protein